ncbi:MAG: DivIVA domain-containing protein [Bacteroidota bacterium]
MKITPLEIRQKDFEKKLRGYDKDEVNAFLQSLSNEWERVLEDNKELNLRLQRAEREVRKLREVESSLYKTLKTAEDTGANVIEQANKAAELHMKETQMNAEALLNESKNKARSMIEQAEMEARQIIEELQDAVRNIEQNHRDIENHRQMALQELKNLSISLIEKVERNTHETKEFRFDDYVKRVKKLARESEKRIKTENTEVQIENKKIHSLAIEEERVKKDQLNSNLNKKPVHEPPQTDELRKRIIGRREKVEEEKMETMDAEKLNPKTNLSENQSKPKLQPEPQTITESSHLKEEKEEKSKQSKGRHITKTASFFDELDTES